MGAHCFTSPPAGVHLIAGHVKHLPSLLPTRVNRFVFVSRCPGAMSTRAGTISVGAGVVDSLGQR